MINILPHLDEAMAIYRGCLVQVELSISDADCVILDGTEVSKGDLDALFLERMSFDWKGQPFRLYTVVEGIARGQFLGGSSAWAHEHSLIGDQYTGWYGKIPEDEIENVWVEKFDLLLKWQYENEMGTKPTWAVYRFVRPATEQEWMREEPASNPEPS